MKNRISYALAALVAACFAACQSEVEFTQDRNRLLTFGEDTVRMDTVFANVPSSMRTFWVYNHSGQDIRMAQVRLQRGGQTGFRVNVDGTYLGEKSGFQTTGVELRDNDSLRVFVELTAPNTHQEDPVAMEDELLFNLESGAQQRVLLTASAWDATLVDSLIVEKDTTLGGAKPSVFFGNIVVKAGATLTIAPGTTLYFAANAGLKVHGRLVCDGTPEANVTLRGNRLDRMFDYLPYDRVSGQWQGVRLFGTSRGNTIAHTDLHGAFDAIVVDSTALDHEALSLSASTVHNCQGYGLLVKHAKVSVSNTQITNTLHDLVCASGGDVSLNHCTLAQFYPYDANRGFAIHLVATEASPLRFSCLNTLATGYADRMIGRDSLADAAVLDYRFDHSLLRMPKPTTGDSLRFAACLFENVKDTLHGEGHFRTFDTDNLYYDFHLKATSAAIDKASTAAAPPTDRDGTKRDAKPDIGAFEFIPTETKR